VRYAVCNEMFGALGLDRAAAIAAAEGYGGLELAPFTLFGDFSAGAFHTGVAAARAALRASGLEFVGFHWLLVGPEGLHIACPDPAPRRKAWDHVARLVDAAAELGGGVLVLGSPKQRSSVPGSSREAATALLAEGLAGIAPRAAAASSPILLEALSSDQTDVVNTIAEARALVESIGSPGIGGMFDFHNTGDETSPWPELIGAQAPFIAHVHANEPDGSCPRRGGADFGPAFDALRDIHFRGWVSVEAFDLPADPAATLREGMALFRSLDHDSAPACGGPNTTRKGERT
jgi:D-psicose/D-tagatose/L-ribulose 3-epimerase